MSSSFAQILRRLAAERPQAPALTFEGSTWTFAELQARSARTARALQASGIRPGDRVGMLSRNCAESFELMFACSQVGAILVGLNWRLARAEIAAIVDDARPALIVAGQEESALLDGVARATPGLHRVVLLGPEYEAWRAPHPADDPGHSGAPDEVALLLYTSGTTGLPKGAMVANRNLVFQVASAPQYLNLKLQDRTLSFLPLCHIAERMIGGYIPIMRRSVTNFVENPETVFENLREVQPQVFFAVPRVWEKVYSQVMITLSEADRVQKLAYGWAVSVGQRVAECADAGRVPGLGLRLQHALANFLVLDNVRRMTGMSRVQLALTGAAPISPELIRWYRSLGVPLREGWGMTETCAGGTVNPRRATRPGSIGVPGPGLEMRIAEGSDEILLRGPNVILGYLNQPEKTAEAIDAQGWLHTGDVGRVDDDGYFYITDRMKDIIITAGGKNITPSEWENQLKFSPYVTDAVVIGDKRAFLTAIVMIDQENVERYAQERDIPFSNYASLTRAPEIQALIQAEVDRVNKQFARVEQVKKFFLLDKQLTAEDEELTPTMKLKRKLVQQKYAEQIEGMYRGG